ncbi:MAG: hypothetical protein AAF196_08975 [Planctomycetota bacterium]
MSTAIVERIFDRATSIEPQRDSMFRSSDPARPGLQSRVQRTPANYHDLEAGLSRRGLPGLLTATFENKQRSLIAALYRHYREFRNRAFSVRLSAPHDRTEQVVYERAPRFDVTNINGSTTVVLRTTLTSPQPTE